VLIFTLRARGLKMDLEDVFTIHRILRMTIWRERGAK